MKQFAKRMKKAFTITELVIVIAVIAILAAVLIPTFAGVIENAKQSAAMQQCKNALTSYSVQAQEEGNPTAGVVFVSNDYAFVTLGNTLHSIGKLDDLPNINASGETKGKLPDKVTVGTTAQSEKDFSKATFTEGKVQVTLTNRTGDTDTAQIDLPTNEGKSNEVLYIYTVEINNTTYVGYFTYETSNPHYAIEEDAATYSRKLGYVAVTGSAGMELDVGTGEKA